MPKVSTPPERDAEFTPIRKDHVSADQGNERTALVRTPEIKPQSHVQDTRSAPLNKRAQSADLSWGAKSPVNFDRLLHAGMARLTQGLSPSAMWLAYADWAVHLSLAPGRQQQLLEKGLRKSVQFLTYLSHRASDSTCPACIEPLAQDRRFRSAAWQQAPFVFIYQAFLLTQQWWHGATTGIGGVSPHHEDVVTFGTRQLLDAWSPVNFIYTNPDALDATMKQGGQNLIRGMMNFWEDWERAIGGKPPIGAENFRPGEQVATTRGKVVYRNQLIELLQYEPLTERVHAEPLLIVPAWIMKYYILDLSPGNSLTRYLVENGYTVFAVSWHNPNVEDRDLSLDDYLRMGVLDALEAVGKIIPGQKINALGYCLGGTLLSVAAAFLAREQSRILNTITLLATQTDFTEPGELGLFIDHSQLSFLEDMMWNQGYLDTRQMAGAFQLLRSNDLVWSKIVHEYMMGRRSPMFDLMAWNADTTRMPYRMHSEYLRRLFLGNDLFEGRYKVEGRPVVLSDIRAPLFAVSTEWDHVAPWRSVYKLNLIGDADVTFLLTNGGHNAGIISEPGHKGRHFRMSRRAADDPYVDPETWYARTRVEEGSWWPAWLSWLDSHATAMTPPPSLGAPEKGYPPLEDAPGLYVFER